MTLSSGRNRIVKPAGIELTMAAEEKLEIGAGTRILSLGSGTGDLEIYLASKYGLELVGVDMDAAAVAMANASASSQGLKNKVQFLTADAAWLDFPDRSFDLIFSCGSLLGFFDRGVAESSRILRTGGHAVFIDLVPICADLPENFIDYWNERGVRLLPPNTIEAEFHRRGFVTHHRKVYHEPFWWEIYFRNMQETPLTLHMQTYRECAGVMLGIFRKTAAE